MGMASIKSYRKHSKLWSRPKNPFDKRRMKQELSIIVKFGLKNKRELWKIQLFLSKIRKTSRNLLNKNHNINLSTNSNFNIIWFCYKYNLFNESKYYLEDTLTINIQDILSRRFQTIVFNKQLSKSIHKSRMLINHKKIEIAGKICNKPAFLVKKDNEQFILYTLKYLKSYNLVS